MNKKKQEIVREVDTSEWADIEVFFFVLVFFF